MALVRKQIANESIRVLLLHCEGILEARSQNAWSKDLGKAGNVCFIGGSELNQPGEMGHKCIESGNICQAQLNESILKHGNAS